jgi:xylulokinase/erythritol kinase
MITIGVDAGTSVIKAVAFDEDGHDLVTVIRPNAVRTPKPGWSEQDMAATFGTVADAVAAAVRESPGPVGAIALTAQGDGLWLADRKLTPAGPALLWNDSRASAVFDRWWQDGTVANLFGITGSVGGPGSPHALLQWLRKHDPSRLDGTVMLTCGGWIFGCLTGQLVSDRSDACSPFGDVMTGGWSATALDAFGLGWAQPMLPDIVDGDGRIGLLSASSAQRFGLPAGLPVVLAPYDIVSTAHGAGALRPGDATIILGTTLCAELLTTSPALDRSPSGVTLSASLPGHWIVAQPALVGTGVLEWAATLLGVPGAAGLSDLAGQADASAVRPLVLPYVAPGGERAPFYDPDITGTILGLRSWHRPGDVALAVFEGLSLAVADCLAVAGRPTRVMLAGGGQASALWCQLVADACAVEVHQVLGAQPGARGAAMCARVLLGHESGWPALQRWLRPGATWAPDPRRSAYWAGLRPRFREAREHMLSIALLADQI